MNIPDKAVEAAVQALFKDGCGEPKVDASTVLEAAAPFIAAQAFRDFLAAVDANEYTYGDLLHHAMDLEAGQ